MVKVPLYGQGREGVEHSIDHKLGTIKRLRLGDRQAASKSQILVDRQSRDSRAIAVYRR